MHIGSSLATVTHSEDYGSTAANDVTTSEEHRT